MKRTPWGITKGADATGRRGSRAPRSERVLPEARPPVRYVSKRAARQFDPYEAYQIGSSSREAIEGEIRRRIRARGRSLKTVASAPIVQ